MGAAWPELHDSVLNVAARAWTHIIPDSYMVLSALGSVLEADCGDLLDVRLAIVVSQGNSDDVDGTSWADLAAAKGSVFLLQESIGDPVVPNQGTAALGLAPGAIMVGPPIHEIAGMEDADEVGGAPGLAQCRVPDTGVCDGHGFAAHDPPAGDAAIELILAFIESASNAEPQITVPDGCTHVTSDGSCDVEGMG